MTLVSEKKKKKEDVTHTTLYIDIHRFCIYKTPHAKPAIYNRKKVGKIHSTKGSRMMYVDWSYYTRYINIICRVIMHELFIYL